MGETGQGEKGMGRKPEWGGGWIKARKVAVSSVAELPITCPLANLPSWVHLVLCQQNCLQQRLSPRQVSKCSLTGDFRKQWHGCIKG